MAKYSAAVKNTYGPKYRLNTANRRHKHKVTTTVEMKTVVCEIHLLQTFRQCPVADLGGGAGVGHGPPSPTLKKFS